MIAANNAGTIIEPNKEEVLIQWTSEGNQNFLGFMGTGSFSGYFKLYVKEPEKERECRYVYQTSPSNRTTYVVDRVERFEQGTIVELVVEHDSSQNETFYGTLLGGVN